MSRSNHHLRLPLYATLASTLMLLAFVLFVLQLNEPIVRWAELFLSRLTR
ncbi:MAG TPA: hypothetical protein VJK02_24825 [Anaerolineales bacterium]|nr:hypothetical protein [Anaerolineales bacterium]